jgi:hypothetical protein
MPMVDGGIHCAREAVSLDGIEVLDRGNVVLDEQQHARGNGRGVSRLLRCRNGEALEESYDRGRRRGRTRPN